MDEDEEFIERQSSPGAWCCAASQYHRVVELIGPASDGDPNSIPNHITAFCCNAENAVELYLKAFLLAKHVNLSKLIKLSHGLRGLRDLAKSKGLMISDRANDLIELLDDGKKYKNSKQDKCDENTGQKKQKNVPHRYPLIGIGVRIHYSNATQALQEIYKSILPEIRNFYNTPSHNFSDR